MEEVIGYRRLSQILKDSRERIDAYEAPVEKIFMRAGQAILLMVLLGSLSIAARAMNNEDVVKLVKAGISENLIISTIETSETDFDTSADALIKMKEARVPEAIIQRMIRCPDTSETRNDPTGLHI